MENQTNQNGNVEIDDNNTYRGADMERIRNAKKRRIAQLKRWYHYDKSKEKEEVLRQKRGVPFSRRGPKSVRFSQNLILLEAGNRGDVEEVRRLLGEGVCPDVANDDGLTALHQCAINNIVEMCRILLYYKANVNAKDKELWTPLHAAAICGHKEICCLLMKSGADLLALNGDGNMPYDICEDEDTLDAIENEMANKGITQEQINDARSVPERKMLNDLKSVCGKMGQSGAIQMFSQLDKQGANMLHVAAANGYSDVVRFLVSVGMPLDELDKDGWQPIHVAALYNNLEVIEVLVSHGADIDAHTKQEETVYELVFDRDVYDQLLLLKKEVDKLRANQTLTSSFGLIRRRSSTNPRSASIRRSSSKEKSLISWKEAKQEAEIRLSIERKKSETEGKEGETLNGNHLDQFINSSLRSKHSVISEPIVENEIWESEKAEVSTKQITLDFQENQKQWSNPQVVQPIEDKSKPIIPHQYNSSLSDAEPIKPKPRETLQKPPPVDIKCRPLSEKPPPKVIVGNLNEKPPAKVIVPNPMKAPHDLVDYRVPSAGSTIRPSKSPVPIPRQTPPDRASQISVKSGGSARTTPIGSLRSSQDSLNRNLTRKPIQKPINQKPEKSARPDSCCSVM